MKRAQIIAAIDVGGTFTDAVRLDGRELRRAKVPTTPDDPSRGVAQALAQLGGADLLIHGTTTATNALLECKLAPIVFITTKGMRDVLAIGRQNRDPRDLYSLSPRQRNELVPRSHRLEVNERLGPNGLVEVDLSKAEIEAARRAVVRLKPECIAICLLHSYANDKHERALAAGLRDLGLPIVLSSELAPEFREYERSLVTGANAGLMPLLRSYISALEERVAPARVVIMHSAGGWLPAEIAAREPVKLALSGPAGGIAGVRAALDADGFDSGVAFDVGGTSTDVSLVTRDARLRAVTEIAGLPLRTPSLDIHTIGAGGGSLAWFDAAGALNVGPQSAGAQPGPACYGRGGTQATLTDALVVLGRVPQSLKLGGMLELDHKRAEQAVSHVGATYMSPLQSAGAIVRVALAGIERALRRVTVERGISPSGLPLVPFGGAGGLIACELAELLDMETILVPRDPGLLCALGMLQTPASRDFSRTLLLSDGDKDCSLKAARMAAELEKRGIMELLECGLTGPFKSFASLDVRYAGQSFELNVPLKMNWRKLFDAAHKIEYGDTYPERRAEIVNVRMRVIAEVRSKLPVPEFPRGKPRAEKWKSVLVFNRDDLPQGFKLKGPAIVTELSSCLWLAKGWRLDVRKSGALKLKRSWALRALTRARGSSSGNLE
ncbi:MAG: hydantoinase/oxoprolinase family protein [Planctomycetes bacterium]|nr:hydantoinase/oxoprolinase family protein [Planctomycetota bacterium]